MHRGEQVFNQHIAQRLPRLFFRGVQQQHEVIQPACQQAVQVFAVRQAQAVAQQAGDQACFFCVSDQVHQIGAQGGLAASEDDMRDAGLPGFVEDGAPFVLGHIAARAVLGGHIECAELANAVGECAVQPVGCAAFGGVKVLPFKVQKGFGVQVGGGDQRFQPCG